MKMGYAFVIKFCNQWCHREHILGIVVLEDTEVAKLTLKDVIVCYNIRSLHINPFSIGGSFELLGMNLGLTLDLGYNRRQ